MATTVTETYILEQDAGNTIFPSTTNDRLQTALSSGVIVSFTKTPIVDGPDFVEGKTRSNVVIVYRSADDRAAFKATATADTELQAYITSSNIRRINLTES